MAVTKVTTKVIADDAVTIDKINDSALVTEAEGISSNDNDTTVPTSAAVKDYVDTEVAGLVDSAPATLDTLNELAAALGDDANFSTTITNSIATKQDASTALTTSTSFSGDVSGTYNAIVVADDSHNHTISNVDGLQTALDAKVDGTGTAGTLPKMSDSDTITDSAISESGEIIDIDTTGAIRVPDGTTAQRPGTPVAGMFRYNTTDGQFEGYTTEWGAIAGSGGAGGGAGSVYVVTDQFTGDGSTTAFTLSDSVTDSDAVQIYLNGVYQNKSAGNYSISGTTLTFVTAPTNSTEVEAVHFVSTAATSLDAKQFTGDGSTTDFDLVDTVADEKYTFVFIQGVYQEKSTYSISGSTLTFSTAPQNGYTVEVMVFGTSISTGGGVSWDTTVKTSAFTASAGKGYFVNTTSAAITVTLPSSPSAGDEVTIVDYAGTADTNNITITSSDNINGSSNDVLIDYERGGVSMVYVDSTQGWISYNAVNETATALTDVPPGFAVDYLVVAGGGSGGGSRSYTTTASGAGGAGGLRTSYGSTTGGGGSAENSLNLETATNYTVTVGAGGAGNISHDNGNAGSNSVFATITSTGGGYGSGGANSYVQAGSGGSGGGSHYGGTGGAAVTSPAVQGYAGGDDGSNERNGAGGGGAGSAGSDSASSAAGDGGNGLAVSITGSSVTYAGGGGGGATYTGEGGTGGTGGGGNGADGNTSAAAGTSNTGGGGGGGSGSDTYGYGAAGGSGVVIIRYPNTFTVSIGSGLTGSTATDGSDKVTTFTAGTGTISFS